MVTPQVQIKVNVPVNLKEYIESKAQKFGIPLAGYIKHLILKDVEDMDYPTFELSKKSEKALKEAVKEEKEGKLVPIDDVDEYFNNL